MNNRNTKQKELIAKAIESKKTFFNAEQLYESVKDQGISQATVYRYLKEAVASKDLFSYVCDRRAIYSKQESSHCHFTCEKTGKVYHIEINNLDFLKNKLPGDITSFQIEIKGICHDCK